MRAYRTWGGLVVLAALLGGCQDPAYDAALTQRQAHFDQLMADARAREAGRPEDLKELALMNEDLQRIHYQRLGEMFEQIQRKHRRDQKHWQKEAPLRKKQLERMMKGHPEQIPEVWGEMTY